MRLSYNPYLPGDLPGLVRQLNVVYQNIVQEVNRLSDNELSNTTDDLTEGTANLYYTDERVRDAMGTALVAGANVTITPDDAGDTITIAASGGGDIRDTWLMG